MMHCLLLLLSLPLTALVTEELVEVDNKVARCSVRVLDAKTRELRGDITKDYLHRDNKFKLSLEPVEAKPGAVQFPASQEKADAFLDERETYQELLAVKLPMEAPDSLKVVPVKATSQGCADQGVRGIHCVSTQRTEVVLTGFSETPAAGLTADVRPNGTFGGDESSRLAALLEHASFWLILTTFFGAGLLLALTPCVFPMIPILSGIIVGHGHSISRRRALALSSAYVMGMALTYAMAGVFAGLSGSLLSSAFQNAWVLGGFALIFVLLALSMFGFYELQLPAFLQSKMTEEVNRQKGGSLHGVAFMGALSALIVGPCVAAPLAGVLLYITQTRDALLGGTALFVMALGMGAPLIAVGVSACHWMPRAGPWMEAVKKFFGVLMLALAIWLVSPVIPPAAHLLAWGALTILTAMYLKAIDPLPVNTHNWARFWKGIGLILLLAGASLVVGALGGAQDPLRPLSFLQRVKAAVETPVKFERVRTAAELDARLQATTRPVMLDFYADWCISCKEMERITFADPQVAARLGRMTLLQVDVTGNSAADKELLKRFSLFGPPGIIFFDKQGREVTSQRAIGYVPAGKFVKRLDTILET